VTDDARGRWLFDEFRGHRWLDAAEVETYEASLKPDLAAERDLLFSLGLRPEHTLIDFGAGTGVRALEAATICRRVIAVDPSEAMLDYIRHKAAERGLTNIEFVQRGFLTYEHDGEPADTAVTRHALHHLPDFWKMEALRRVHAVLKPGGIFFLQELVYSFDPDDAAAAINRWIDGVPADSDGTFSREFFAEHVREKHATYAWIFEGMLHRTGFEIRDASYSEPQTHARYVCVRQP
jgi:ubiquinone/menaquinone biosynthesis C-methylase UbiE